MIPQPLFVLAPANGESARLAAMLGAHPRGYLVPELNLMLADTIGELIEVFRMSGESGWEHGLLRTLGVLFGPGDNDDGIESAKRWLARRVDWPTEEVIWELARAVAPRQLVVPEVTALLRADLIRKLDRCFPDARWLHVVRHPRIYSQVIAAEFANRLFIPSDFLDHNEKCDPLVLDPQVAWYRYHLTIDRATAARTAGPASVRRIRAEAVMSAPEQELAALARWLGWEGNNEVVELMLMPERSPFAQLGPRGARYGFDREFLDSPIFQRQLRARFMSLDGPLPWRPDGQGFATEVISLANTYGYA